MFRILNFYSVSFQKDYLVIKDYTFLCIGCVLAAFTGAGLPHLVCVVGWLLNAFVMVEPTSEAFRAKTTPLLLYFVSASVVLAIIAFLQFFCFRLTTLKVSRRIRRRYFQSLISQRNEFYENKSHKEENAKFEADIEKFLKALTESLPNIISTIAQIVTALLISFSLSVKLSIPITALGIFCAFWFLVFNCFLTSETQKEQRFNAKTLEALKTSTTFKEHCQKQFYFGIRKSIFAGILIGSTQLFIYSGMGLGALYGNWLIDQKLLEYPGFIFVIACTIIPACMKFGQLYLNLSNFYQLRFIFTHFKKFPKKDTSGLSLTVIEVNGDSPPEYWQNSEITKKQFLLSYFKNEVGSAPEEYYEKNSSAFMQLRKSALKKKIYILGFNFCLIFAVAPPTFTKLNGDLYEFYKIGRTGKD